jgi:beta-1,4-mannosyl-glycoprotein beta-1,4-N-acetylglucosaminyltransferase|tara:strand:- start:2269 stop:3150 length:882 start_codon:yes stop_codon:yes gene_type:complete
MFFDEEMLLDLRLNIMNKYIDKFVITEATYTHSGKPKKLFFDINKFSKFKDKIIYIVVNKQPTDLLKINENDSDDEKLSKKTDNAKKREVLQINKTQDGFINADPDDIIIISDLDEIPNLKEIDFKKIKQKLIFFKQKMFYYKLNLFYKSLNWYGTKACRKKNLITPEYLRSSKNKKYSLWRFDVLFSKFKYNSIHFVKNGGWHFSNIRKPEDLEKKMQNFLHHVDYEQSGLKLNDLKKFMKEKKVMYDHSMDKKENKWGEGEKLQTTRIEEMPEYILKNIEKYKYWLDTEKN